jgi:hypothetical protein
MVGCSSQEANSKENILLNQFHLDVIANVENDKDKFSIYLLYIRCKCNARTPVPHRNFSCRGKV